jgi:hypothetical protein
MIVPTRRTGLQSVCKSRFRQRVHGALQHCAWASCAVKVLTRLHDATHTAALRACGLDRVFALLHSIRGAAGVQRHHVPMAMAQVIAAAQRLF